MYLMHLMLAKTHKYKVPIASVEATDAFSSFQLVKTEVACCDPTRKKIIINKEIKIKWN